MEPVLATAEVVDAAEPTHAVAPVVTAVAEASVAAVPVVTAVVEAGAVPMVTAYAEATTGDDIPEATAEVTFVSVEVAADRVEKRGRKSGTKVPRWTPEEEARLRALIEEPGTKPNPGPSPSPSPIPSPSPNPNPNPNPGPKPNPEHPKPNPKQELGEKQWGAVAGRLETGRSPAGVEQHWQIMNGKRKRNGEAVDKSTAGEAGAEEGEPQP
jgi:hypothetical protein